jgi:DNA-binding transcriptional LysR family regulator
MGGVELRQLEYFLAVADNRSFTQAAKRLHVVQSGVSATIKALERELGAELFVRGPAGATLTPAGQELRPRARATLDAAHAARDAVNATRGDIHGTVRLGTLTSIDVIDLPALLAELHARHPGVRIQLRTASAGTTGLTRQLRDGDLDIAFLVFTGAPPADLRARLVAAVPLLLVVPEDHPLAERDSVELAELAGMSFVDGPPGYGNRIVVDEAFASAGVERTVALEVADLGTAAAYIRRGLGIGFLFPLVLDEFDDAGLATLRVADHELIWRLYVATSATRPPSAATRALLALIEEFIHKVRNRGPIAGTGADGAIPGIGAADLGEIVALPDGSYVAVFGDAFQGDKVGADPHYASVAVPVTFDDAGRPRFGKPLTGPDGSPRRLFRTPPRARGTNTLPAGSIQVDGKTYLMVVGTADLTPVGGSWLVEVTDRPGHRTKGWKPVDGSWRPANYAAGGQSQISGYQGSDGMVYIVADAFDRSKPITLYRAQPSTCTDRSSWQPCVLRSDGSHRWGTPGQTGDPISGPEQRFGELSFREIDGRAVLSSFNGSQGLNQVEVRVAAGPTEIFTAGRLTVVAQQSDPHADNYVLQNYGGYIVPGSTLGHMRTLVSQWNTATNATYNVLLLEFEVMADLLGDGV